ncbi:unnamed protein product [Owenia fusiformis]|uniref:Uncharacterized protein n=1 Tax=Owenia fusiformis TaxID=6347 RepID=A0A8S4NAC3_OWEFU|nr:unnamed protein product [Owenia fusiformis]
MWMLTAADWSPTNMLTWVSLCAALQYLVLNFQRAAHAQVTQDPDTNSTTTIDPFHVPIVLPDDFHEAVDAPGAETFGITAVILMCVPVFFIILLDFHTLHMHYKRMMKKNIKYFINHIQQQRKLKAQRFSDLGSSGSTKTFKNHAFEQDDEKDIDVINTDHDIRSRSDLGNSRSNDINRSRSTSGRSRERSDQSVASLQSMEIDDEINRPPSRKNNWM